MLHHHNERSIEMRRSYITIMIELLLIAATAGAQTTATEPSRVTPSQLVFDIRAELGADAGDYQISTEGDGLRLADRRSGLPLLAIIERSPTELTLQGVVGSLAGTDNRTRRRVTEEIASFNERSSVGTLRIEEGTGRIILWHHMDPAGLSAAEIARLTVRFARIAHQESIVIGRMTVRI